MALMSRGEMGGNVAGQVGLSLLVAAGTGISGTNLAGANLSRADLTDAVLNAAPILTQTSTSPRNPSTSVVTPCRV